MKYYVDAQGNYLGGWDENPPAGATEVTYAPEDARQVWDFKSGVWLSLPPKWVISARRYAAETSGITVGGMRVETDDRSKLLVNGAAVEAMLDPDYSLKWKTLDGFVVLTGEQVLGVARAVRAHVQACFDREAELLAAVEDGTYTEAMLDQGWPV